MGRTYQEITERLAQWLEAQPVFFVASAPSGAGGHVNLSPKGNRNELAVLGPTSLAYLDQTGSGAETIAHIRENGRLVVMACAFSGPPRIVRFHGQARVVRPGEPEWDGLAAAVRQRGGAPDAVGVRSIVVLEVERVADSCGYGVPLMALEGHRPTMEEWAARKGTDGIAAYQEEKNGYSIDGLPALSGGPGA